MTGATVPEPEPQVERGGAEAAKLFQGLAEVVYDSDDFDDVYAKLCEASRTLVTGCDRASLMLKRGSRFVTAAATDDIAARVDDLERELGDGPCLDAVRNEAAYVDASLPEESRWPGLATRIMDETPVRGVAGFRLLVDEEKIGALNLFSDAPGVLTERSVDEGAVVAAFLSVSLLAAHRRQQASSLQRGLHTNREIGKAVGLMMAFHKVDDEIAFEILRKASQDMNVKLAEVAREVVAHHNARRG